jgi:hypothetical protein
LIESNIVAESRLAELACETSELTAVLVTCVKNAKGRMKDEG